MAKTLNCEDNRNVSTQTLKKAFSRVARTWETGPSNRKYKALLHLVLLALPTVVLCERGGKNSMTDLYMQLYLKKNFKSVFWLWLLLNQSGLLKKCM